MTFSVKTTFSVLVFTSLVTVGGCAHTQSPTNDKKSLASFCRVGENLVVGSYQPSVKPKYFFKPVGTSDEIAFVGFDEKTGLDQNYLLHLPSRKTIAIPGNLDPIGLYKTDLLSVPLDDGKGQLQMAFYDVRDLREKSLAAKPLLPPDASLVGRYQSMGVLKRNGTLVRFRMITDGHQGGDYRDYEADFSSSPAHLKTISSSKLICKNLRDRKTHALKFKLPMISKDAKFFSAFDLEEQKMRVFHLSSNGNCTETKNPTLSRGDIGKIDFSETSKEVAFHYSDRSLTFSPIEFGIPETSWQLRGAVYDFGDESYRLLPFFGKDTQLYYPTFLPNGHIMALKIDHDHSEFLEVDIGTAKRTSRRTIERYASLSDEEFKSFQKLSQLWMNACLNDSRFSMRTNRMLSLFSLTRSQCLELAGPDHLEKACDLLD